MSSMAPSPPMEMIGGQRKNSSSVNSFQLNDASSGSCTTASYFPSASFSARRTDTKPSVILRMCASNRPMASDGESWKRWFAQGNGYGLYGYVLAHTEEHPVELALPSIARPFPLRPSPHRPRRARRL